MLDKPGWRIRHIDPSRHPKIGNKRLRQTRIIFLEHPPVIISFFRFRGAMRVFLGGDRFIEWICDSSFDDRLQNLEQCFLSGSNTIAIFNAWILDEFLCFFLYLWFTWRLLYVAIGYRAVRGFRCQKLIWLGIFQCHL